MCKPPRSIACAANRSGEGVIHVALLKTERVVPALRIAKNG